MMFGHRRFVFTFLLLVSQAAAAMEPASSVQVPRHWLWSRAHAIPKETTSEESGYFSIVEGKNGSIYIGTAKYGDNAYLVEFEPATEAMKIVLDAEKEIGVDRKGFAAQAKFHTRNNVGRSGKIYLGTKQGYIQDKTKETLSDYPGGHPMVFDPATGKTKVYDVPVPHQGIIWEISPDRKTLYAVAMSHNGLFSYDLIDSNHKLKGKSIGPLVKGAEKTDCRAMCVAPNGVVWAGVMATLPGQPELPRLVSFTPGDAEPIDHGPIAIGNPKYSDFHGSHQHGVHEPYGEQLVPRFVIMGICPASDETVYLTTLNPFTLHAIRIPKVAGVTTIYHHNSHSDVILTRLLKTDTLDGKGQRSTMKLTSLYVDQVRENDLSHRFSQEHSVPISSSVADSLKTDKHTLGVDGVLLVAEHGEYPRSDTGQIIYPKRRLFGEITAAFRQSGKVVPVFNDKHLADNWKDAKWLYDTAKNMQIPLMAGSSLPVLWRYPAADVRRGAKVKEIVAVSYGSLDAYGFHALEMVQSLVERRKGGETGVASVQCLTGAAVWQAGREGVFERELLDAALSRLKRRPLPDGTNIEDMSRDPVLFVIDYRDGLRASVLTPGVAVNEWAVAWRYGDDDPQRAGKIESTTFWTQEARPFMHFTYLNAGIEKMMHTGKPTWPVERTLLTSGVLDALLMSKRDGGLKLETPWLDVVYESNWNWKQLPPPPPGRPIMSQ